MRSSVVVLENHLVESFFIIWPFSLQCSAQLHQLLLIVFPSDGFVRLEQLIIPCTHLIQPVAVFRTGVRGVGLVPRESRGLKTSSTYVVRLICDNG
ncbi:hypothetical protein AVEN_8630-1 [Araneus ventricosus]|uniref:Uncharacterized protein n=1 Tax=Araneus ventricosus TaxID=182803 RepID=A0A4Y2C3Q4_ARAVE|nr:hypothetical protein AVEN_8630-1 [Araneus ventricosus]